MHPDPIPPGLCQCGCGQATAIAPKADRAKGWTRGEPLRFKRGHNGRKRIRYVVTPGPLDTACHVSTLAKAGGGYVLETVSGVPRPAHAVAWERVHGPVPAGRELDHLCRVRACVNPEHLEAVTHVENIRRGRGTKLTAEKVNEIRSLCTQGWLQQDIADAYGIRHAMVSAIKRGRAWRPEGWQAPDVAGLLESGVRP